MLKGLEIHKHCEFQPEISNMLNFSIFLCSKKGRVLLWEGQSNRVDIPFSKWGQGVSHFTPF